MAGKIKFTSVLTLVVAVAACFLPVASASAADRVPSDTYFDNQWYLAKIGAPEAWNRSIGFEGVIVAVIDSGVDISHPDLKDNIWRNIGEVARNGRDDDGNGFVDDVNGWDFVGGDNDPHPDLVSGDTRLGAVHGTVSAGIIAARGDNGRGIAGVTWQTTIMPLRVLDANGQGDPGDVVRAVEYAVRGGAKVINLSLAGTVRDENLARALRRAYDAGVFVVAAAGNAPEGGAAFDLDRNPRYPACLDFGSDENFVYGVAAVDDVDRRASFSNYGAGCVDLSAPGTRFVGLRPYQPGTGGFDLPYGGYYNGTSLAASVVSGAVALVKALDPNLTPKQVMNVLTASADSLDARNPDYFGKLGRGRLNVARAVEMIVGRPPDTKPTVLTSALTPDGRTDRLIVAASGPGRATEVRMFTADGAMVRSFTAFSAGFRGGATVAAADFDGGGRRSIVVGAGGGGSPQVRIFDLNGTPIGGFIAYADKFRGGVGVVSADVDGDGRDEIVTAPASGGGPHIRVFSARGVLVGGFFAFGEKERGSWRIAAADFDGDGEDEIAVLSADGSMARIFDGRGRMIASFAVPGAASVRRSAALVAADGDGDGRREVALLMSEGGSERLAFYRLDGSRAALYEMREGVLPGEQSWAFGSLSGAAPLVRLPDGRGNFLSFQAFEKNFRGGVTAVRLD
jgi:subtilisin family serine protease